MRIIFTIFVCLLFTCGVEAQTTVSVKLANFKKEKLEIESEEDANEHFHRSLSFLEKSLDDYVFVIAHRGDWRNAPENSLQAIQNCIELGADAVEVDIRETKDGELVLIHDKTLNRTTSGKGKVKKHSLAQLRQLKLRDDLLRLTEHRIPTLKEALQFAKGKIIVDLDVKADVEFSKIHKILEETATFDQVIIRSNKTLKEAKKYYGSALELITYIPGICKKTKNISRYIHEFEKGINPNAYVIRFKKYDAFSAACIDRLVENKDKVWVHAISSDWSMGHDDESAIKDPEGVYGGLVERGVRMIQTDRPELLIKYLESKGLR